ncbi:MAG: FAD-binding oxidoreductase, partial [Nocardioides sp.]|nr:FAD-binding oxidoreductase [Nocardioides sp.]
HYDQGRIGAIDAMYVPTVLGTRSMRRFPALAEASGITFTSAMPLLTSFPAGGAPAADDSTASWRNIDALLANVAEFGGRAEVLSAEEVAARFPQLRVPANEVAVLQEDTLLVNPRLITEAELVLADKAGATRLEDEVTSLERTGSTWRAQLRHGEPVVADRVVVAVGAYTNASGLLAPYAPGPLSTGVFGCTIVLLEVDGPDAADFPGYMFSSDHYGGGLITPPRQYPDGRWYLKAAGGELIDHPLRATDEIDSWVRSGGSASEVDWFRQFVADTIPGVEVSRAITKPCLPTFNSSGLPYIDRVTDGLVVATEGERGVMMADEIGRLAAGLAGQDRWIDPLPSHLFAAQWVS